jgi:hypothetical protein
VNISEESLAKKRHLQLAPSTAYAIASSSNHLREFYESTIPNSSSGRTFDELSREELNLLLERFYTCCRTQSGENFKATSLRTMRLNISRYLKTTHSADITKDPEFNSSNIVFTNKMKELKAQGKGYVEHHSDISEADLKIIVGVLSTENAVELQLLIWFYLQLFFCRRGVENQPNLLKDHYVVRVVEGKNCIVQKRDELTKNHRELDSERVNGGIIMEQDHDKCPVKVFKKYLDKLDNKSPYLWQLPLPNHHSDGCWYSRKVGANTIKSYMKKICSICELPRMYTNHCVRATTCTLLGSSHSDINVQSVSGHKSLSGLSQYKRINNFQKFDMCHSLAKSLGFSASASTISTSLPNNDLGEATSASTISTSLPNNDLGEVTSASTISTSLPNNDLGEATSASTISNSTPTANININTLLREFGCSAVQSMFTNCNVTNVSIHFHK